MNRMRATVWDTYVGHDIPKHKCFCCKRATMRITDFHMGHVISTKAGGETEISNLRPICAPCNLSMGARAMQEYVEAYEYYV